MKGAIDALFCMWLFVMLVVFLGIPLLVWHCNQKTECLNCKSVEECYGK